MQKYIDLLKQLNPEPAAPAAFPFASPEDAAMAEMEMAPAPSRSPAIGSNSEVAARVPASVPSTPAPQNISAKVETAKKTSGNAPESKTDIQKLEELLSNWKTKRDADLADAADRQMKAEMLQGLTKNIGLIVGGAQAMNTGAKVTPAQVETTPIGDLQAIVERKYKPEYEQLMEQYKLLKKDQNEGMTPYQMLSLQMKKAMFDEAQALRESNQNRLKEERFEKDLQRASDKLGNSQELLGSLDNFESKIGHKLDDLSLDKNRKLLDKDKKELDLPGVSVPGMGRLEFYSGEARDLDTAMAKIFNVELKDRSGATVTTPEMDRLRNEFAKGKFNTEAEMIQAIKDYKGLVARELRNREAQFRPDVIEEYKQRGGATSDRFNIQKPAPQQKQQGTSGFPRQVRNAKTGEVATVSNEQELNEAQSEGFN